MISLCLLAGCKSPQSADNQDSSAIQVDNASNPIKVTCNTPRMVQDIWKLEPMLTEKGLIKADMNRDEKEKIIRSYIAKKNEQYQKCNQGK